MPSNAYFPANFRFDTAENEPDKKLQTFANFPNFANPNDRRYLTDGTPKPWESQCQTCLRTENAGAYVLGTTAQQVRPQNNFEYSVDFEST